MPDQKFAVVMLFDSNEEAVRKGAVLQELVPNSSILIGPWYAEELGKQVEDRVDIVFLDTPLWDLPIGRGITEKFPTAIRKWLQEHNQKIHYRSIDYTLGELLEVPISFLREIKGNSEIRPEQLEAMEVYLHSLGFRFKE